MSTQANFDQQQQQQDQQEQDIYSDIAIIAMVGRFPEADDLDTFWRNLADGVESVKTMSNESISGGSLDNFINDNPNFVYAQASLDSEMIKCFDAAFFNISPREAQIMDPQQRMYLEACWQLFELSGYSTEHYDGRVGVFGSSAYSGYIENFTPEVMAQVGIFQAQLGNDKDFLSTKVSYKMGFTGPSMNINTLCSSAALGIHLARESLLNYQCDYAMAGGINVSVGEGGTSYYHEGGIGADEGHCRAYDENASGTVAGNGMGIIAMKRLEDALEDGDNILAIIKGTAVNNDGSDKASYTAPSPEGQAQVIAECLAIADVHPETISYIDGHGTGTYIGDPIEIAGLTKAYREHTDKKQFCGIGSVKTNIGHLVTAGGVASLIKTVLCLQNKQIAPSLNFTTPNPKIDFANSPFFVNDKLTDWPESIHPRRAAVSSFGIGGTNVHTILEEAPELALSDASTGEQVVLLSAKTASALVQMKANLTAFLTQNPQVNLADLAYTLQVGRCSFEHRFAWVGDDINELNKALSLPADAKFECQQKPVDRGVALVFAQQNSPSLADLTKFYQHCYQDESAFNLQELMDNCFDILSKQHSIDLKSILLSDEPSDSNTLEGDIAVYTNVSLFIAQYAQARQYQAFGIDIDAMAGSGVGEFVAGCIAGVLSLDDALSLLFAANDETKNITFNEPSTAYISATSGDWVSEAEVTNVDYWLNVLSQSTSLTADTDARIRALLEAEQYATVTVAANLSFKQSLADLWLYGVKPDWPALYPAQRRRIPLPTYPFERKKHWIERKTRLGSNTSVDACINSESEALELSANSTSNADTGFSTGQLQINIDWNSDWQIQRKQILAVIGLKQQLDQICQQLGSDNHIGISVSGLGLTKANGGLALDSHSTEEIGATEQASNQRAAQQIAAIRQDTPYQSAETDLQQTLVNVWEKALGTAAVGINDNFYDLGGDSLIASLLVNQLKHQHDIEVGLRELLQKPTVAHLAELIETKQWAASGADTQVGSETIKDADANAKVLVL